MADIIDSYLADPSIPVEKRRKLAQQLNDSFVDSNTASKAISMKYGDKYGSMEAEQKKNTPASKIGSAIGSIGGNLLKAAPKLATAAIKGAAEVGRGMTPEDVAGLEAQSKADTAARDAAQAPRNADMQYMNSKGIVPDSNVSTEELGKATQDMKWQTGDMFTKPVTDQVAKGVNAAGEAIKAGTIKGAEGVQKVGAAITGDTSQLEGFRSFYGIKSQEQAAADMKQLNPAERGQMFGEGAQNFVSGTIGASMAPLSGAVEAVPYGKEAMNALGEHVINPVVQEGSKQLKDRFKSMGITLSPEQEASIDEGVGNIANLLMMKSGEDAAKVTQLETLKAGLQKQIPELIQKGDMAGAKALIAKYEQANLVSTTATGRMTVAAGEGAKALATPVVQGVAAIGEAGLNKVGQAVNAAGELGNKIIKRGETAEGMMNSMIKVDPARGAEKFYELSKGETLGRYLLDRDLIGTPEEVITKLADRFQKSKANYDSAISQMEGVYKFDAAKEALTEMKTRFESTLDKANLNKVNTLLQKFDTEGLTMAENLALKRLYESKVKTGYLKDNNSILIDRATNLDSELRTNFNEAAKTNGFANIEELSRETQLAKTAMDSIQSKAIRRLVNNQFSLTDNLLLVGGSVNPAALTVLGLKKVLSMPSIQARIVKALASGEAKAMKEVPGVPTSIINEMNVAKRQAAFEGWLSNSGVGKVINNKEQLALPAGDSMQMPAGSAETMRAGRAQDYRAGVGIFKNSIKPIDEITYQAAVKNGGVTIKLNGDMPVKGYAYSPYKDVETIVPKTDFTIQHVTDFRNKFADKLAEPGNHLGVWEDQGNMYMDVSKVGKANKQTIRDAEAAGQLGVFDLKKFETIKTKLYKEPTTPLASEGAATMKSQTKTYQPATIEEHFKAAEPAKLEIDKQADEIAKKYGATVAKAPLKGMKRSLEKLPQYKGDFTQLQDVARNTIIALKEGSFENIFADISKGKNVKSAKLVTAEKDPLGYSGANIKIKTSNGHIAETQINTPIMIYAKEAASDAIRLLGEELYNKIKDKVGIEGGKGHKYYERWRELEEPKDHMERYKKAAIEEKSKNYYNSIRAAWAK